VQGRFKREGSAAAEPELRGGTGPVPGNSSPNDAAGSDGDSGPTFFDDGGWIAIALLLTCALFLVLSWFLQRKFVPKPLDPDSAASAESGMGLP